MKWILLVAAVLAPAAQAREMLTEVSSEVVQADGMTAAQIAERGLQCLKATAGNVADHVDPALDGDTAYATLRFAYSFGVGVSSTVRARVSVIGKDGRFKVVATDIEQTIGDGKPTFYPIPKAWGTGWKAAESTLQGHAAKVAACVTRKEPEAAADW